MHRWTRGLLAAVLTLVMVLGSVGGVRAGAAGRSAVVGDDVFLEGAYLSVGISGTGSFGTGNAAPAGFHPTPYYGGTVGLSVDQDGFDIGNPPTTGDFFLPGSPEERFVVGYKIGGVPTVFNNAEKQGDYDVVRESFDNLSSGSTLGARWVGLTQFASPSDPEDSKGPVRQNSNAQITNRPAAQEDDFPAVSESRLRVTQVVQFGYDQRFFSNTITLENAGDTPLESVRYMRNVDPDQDQDVSGTFVTLNDVLSQQPADGKALVKASGVATGASISYWSMDPRARVSTFGFSNMDPYDVEAYDQAGVYDDITWVSAKGFVVEDQAISICADLGTIEPGEQRTFVYYTGLEASPSRVITASTGIGGTISPSGEIIALPGSSKTFAITPLRGYVLAALTVDGVRVDRVTTYTFTSIAADHSIHAFFRPADVMGPVIDLPDGVPQGAVGSPYDLHLMVTDDVSIADVGIFENGLRVGGSSTGGDIRIRLTPSDSRHDLVIVALDGAGNRTERPITLVVDTRPPVLTLDPPSSVTTPMLTLSGSVVDALSGLASLSINEMPVIPLPDGSFSEKLALVKGVNTIVVAARDKAGNATFRTFAVTYSASPAASSSLYVVLTIGNADMEVNGLSRKMDAAPFIKDGRTLLPIRALIEALGGSIQWNASTKTATVMLGSRTVVLTIGSKTALVNGSSVGLDVAPMIVGGRTFLPLRAVAENLGLDLAWEPVSRTVSFTYWP